MYIVEVEVDLERTLLLFLNGLSSTTGSGTSSGSTTTGSGSTTSGADVHEQVLDVLTLKRLGEEGSPDRLAFDASGLNKAGELVGLYDESLVSCCSPPHSSNPPPKSVTRGVCDGAPNRDIDVVIRKDERGVGSSKLGGRRHCVE
jgi:hypothetical protein